MRYLKDILVESLLDDEDILMKQADDDILNNAINDEKSGFLHMMNLTPSKYKLEVKGSTLFIPRSSHILPIAQPADWHKFGLNIDTIIWTGGISIKNYGKAFDDTKLCKNLVAQQMSVEAHSIKDINFKITGIVQKPYESRVRNNIIFDCETLVNCNIQFENNPKVIRFSVYDDTPEIKNCKSNVNSIIISDPFILDDNPLTKRICQYWMKKDYVYVNDDYKIPIKTFKKLHAIINNPKKYKAPIEPWAADMKVSDVFPWVNDFKDLTYIVLRNNNIRIDIDRHPDNPSDYMKTGDGWYIKHSKFKI